MTAAKWDDLKKAYRREKDPKVRARMAAVNMVCMPEDDMQDTADRLMQCPNWASHWVRRSEEGGLETLRDLPRAGRPPKAESERMAGIIEDAKGGRIIPKKLRMGVQKSTGILYHITSIRRIMRDRGMSPRTPQPVHTGRSDMEAIRKWQTGAKRQISRLKRQGLVTAVMGRPILASTPSRGRKYWSAAGGPATIPYGGQRAGAVACGPITAGASSFECTTGLVAGRSSSTSGISAGIMERPLS